MKRLFCYRCHCQPGKSTLQMLSVNISPLDKTVCMTAAEIDKLIRIGGIHDQFYPLTSSRT